jgi:glutathione S-transferase
VIRLLGRAGSINVRKVRWTAALLELPVVHDETWGDVRALQDPGFLALNPNGLVPVLVEEADGAGEAGDAEASAAPALVLWESNTICRYLVARQGREDLLPRAPAARARVEQWMDWQATELNTAWRATYMARVRRHPDFPDDERAARGAARWAAAMRLLDGRLAATGAYVAGDRFTLADVPLALSTQRWRRTPLSPAERVELPAVEAWWQRLASLPGFAQHVDNGRP